MKTKKEYDIAIGETKEYLFPDSQRSDVLCLKAV